MSKNHSAFWSLFKYFWWIYIYKLIYQNVELKVCPLLWVMEDSVVFGNIGRVIDKEGSVHLSVNSTQLIRTSSLLVNIIRLVQQNASSLSTISTHWCTPNLIAYCMENHSRFAEYKHYWKLIWEANFPASCCLLRTIARCGR